MPRTAHVDHCSHCRAVRHADIEKDTLLTAGADDYVKLNAAREGNDLVFTVADRGPGVARAEQERIFESFYRPQDQAPDAGHAGVGLSIARRLAVLHNGSLTYSERDGGGSGFTVRLPAVDVESEPEDRVKDDDQHRDRSRDAARDEECDVRDDHMALGPARSGDVARLPLRVD